MTDTINVNVQKSNTTSPRSRVRTPWLMLGPANFIGAVAATVAVAVPSKSWIA
jgi:hypothetical protein